MLIVAPLTGQEPVPLFRGFTGIPQSDTENLGAIVLEPTPRGTRVILGQRRGDLTICDRSALTKVHVLDPASLSMEPASYQSLPQAERAKATKVTAKRLPTEASAAGGLRLLAPKAASSAVGGKMAGIADGDLDSAWSEGTNGDGAGEFVVFSSASEVAIGRLEFVFRP